MSEIIEILPPAMRVLTAMKRAEKTGGSLRLIGGRVVLARGRGPYDIESQRKLKGTQNSGSSTR